MQKNRTTIVLILLLFAIGIMVGTTLSKSSINDGIDDFEDVIEQPNNNYDEIVFIDTTSNLFVKIAKLMEKIINKAITLVVDIITKAFGFVFGV